MSFVLGLAHQRVCGIRAQSYLRQGKIFVSPRWYLFFIVSLSLIIWNPLQSQGFCKLFSSVENCSSSTRNSNARLYLNKPASQPCLKLSRRPVSTIKANSQTPHSPFSPNWIRLLSVQVYSINFTGQLISVEWQARILSLFPSAFLGSNQKSGIGPRTHTP